MKNQFLGMSFLTIFAFTPQAQAQTPGIACTDPSIAVMLDGYEIHRFVYDQIVSIYDGVMAGDPVSLQSCKALRQSEGFAMITFAASAPLFWIHTYSGGTQYLYAYPAIACTPFYPYKSFTNPILGGSAPYFLYCGADTLLPVPPVFPDPFKFNPSTSPCDHATVGDLMRDVAGMKLLEVMGCAG